MPRFVRRALVVAAVLAGLVVVAALALPFLVDVNRYRPLIVARVQEATGRALTLGTISFRLLPAPGLSVGGPIKLSDAADYPGRSALTADSFSIRLGLLGLLRGRASVASITLHQPVLTLIRDPKGRWNFQDLVDRVSEAPPAAKTAGSRDGGSLRIEVARARIQGGRLVVYDDAVTPGRRAQAVIAPLDAEIRGWGGDTPIGIDLVVGIGKSRLRSHAQMSAADKTPRLTLEARGKGIRAEDLVLLLPWLGVARPAGLQVNGSLDLDGSVNLPLEHPETLQFKGGIVLGGLSYKDAGMTQPIKDLSGTLTVDGNRASWKDFGVRIGASTLRGSLQVENFLKPRVGLSLSSPRLDLNEMVATLVPSTPAASTGPPSAEVPTGLLDQISGAGSIDLAQVRFQTFDLADVRASLALSGNVFTLKELTAKLYDGTARGTATVDLSRGVPSYRAAMRLDRLQAEPLLGAYDPALKGLLSGRLGGDLDLDARGAAMDAILKTAHGTGRIDLVDGALTSFSVLKQLASLLEMAGGKGIGRESTPFQSLHTGLTIADGRARTEDLALRSADLDVDGKGWVGLDATLDLDVTARFSKEASRGMVEKNARLSALTQEDRLVLPFTLKGSLASPSFGINTRAQMSTVKEKAKEKLRQRFQDRLLKGLGKPQPEETPP